MFRLPTLITAVFALALLGGCIKSYRMDVGQGNIVTPEMVSQLRLGMTRSQVRFVLGTPLIADSFHPDRWDYYYSLRKGNEPQPQTKRLTVTFKDDALVRVDGDIAASNLGGDAVKTQ